MEEVQEEVGLELKDIRKVENMHVALWLLKDVSWCQSWHVLGLLMVAPTLAVAGYITWKTRAIASEFYHNLVVCLWICANITWMIGEFFFQDGTRGYARFFFFAGMGILAAHYLWELAERLRRRSLKSFSVVQPHDSQPV